MHASDPVTRTLRSITHFVGAIVLVLPLGALVLDLADLRMVPARLSRDVLSILLPLSFVLFAAAMLDFVLTVARVADRLAPEVSSPTPAHLRWLAPKPLLVLLAAVLIGLVALDRVAAHRHEARLAERASQQVDRFGPALERMAAYRFDKAWVAATSLTLQLIERQGGFNSVAVIVPDTVDGQPLYLVFRSGTSIDDDQGQPQVQHLLVVSEDEAAYLDAVFHAGSSEPRSRVSSRSIERWVPVHGPAGRFVLRFVDR